MKKNVLLCLFVSVLLTGCQLISPEPANQNVDALYNRFHGKYKVISSVSSDPVDVNLDGIQSTDMLAELPMLTNEYDYNLELRIQPLIGSTQEVRFLYMQTWPVQFIHDTETTYWQGQPITYNPSFRVSYLASQGFLIEMGR